MSKEQTSAIIPSAFGPQMIHTRYEAERILRGTDVLNTDIDPRNIPIAGLRSVDGIGRTLTMKDAPKEILPENKKPWWIFDLDGTFWFHIRSAVYAVGQATGKPVTMEIYRAVGNTRKVPQWSGDPKVMEIHDQIIQGKHPEYYPYVNYAFRKAVEVVHAIRQMGHGFVYLSARPQSVDGATRRVIEWNGMPINTKQGEKIHALETRVPESGDLYCSPIMPMMVGRKVEFKEMAVKNWLRTMRDPSYGWDGPMVVVDDLLQPFADLMAQKEVVGIKTSSDVNARRPEVPGEIPVQSWVEIGEMAKTYHENVLKNIPLPYRVFDLDSAVLFVDKEAAGYGAFTLDDLPWGSYRWVGKTEEQGSNQFSELFHST